MKGKKWKVQNWRLFCSLQVSYLTILIIPIMGLFIYYVYSSYTLRSEILSKQQSLLTRLQSEMDLRFSSIYSVNDYLASSVDVQDAGKYQADTNLDELFDTLEVQDLLRSTKVTLESYDTFIYFRKSCSVLSTYRRYRKEYLDTYASNYGLTVQEFIDAVSTTSYQEHKIVYTDDNIAQLFFMRAIYVGKENIGSVVTVVPIKSIGQLLENSEWLKDWDCYILSSTDSLLIGGNENRINSINLQAFTQNETLLVIPTEEGEYLGSCVDSTLGVWKYAVCTPKEVAMEKQYALRTFIILDFVFSIFLGLFMSLTMSRRHYTPLQKITETLSHNAREYACLNDLPDVVNNVIVSIKKENQRMEHELYKQYTVLKNQILNRILLGQYGDRASVCQAL